MTVQFAQVKARLAHKEEILLIDTMPFSGAIHKKTDSGKTETSYFNGVKHGVYKEYFANGMLKTIALYKMGKLDGRYIEYFMSGCKRLHVSYTNDKKDGLCEEWLEDGSSKTLKTYYQDKLISIRPY